MSAAIIQQLLGYGLKNPAALNPIAKSLGLLSKGKAIGQGALRAGTTALTYAPALGQLATAAREQDPAALAGGLVTAGVTKAAGGGVLGGLLGTGTAMLGNALIAPTAAATGDIFQKTLNAVTGSRREAGKTGLGGEGVISDEDKQVLRELIKSQPELAAKLLPAFAQMRGVDTENQMKLNQQTAALTGALNQQGILGTLANTSLGESGATVRTMMAAPNPYASSAFSYRGG